MAENSSIFPLQIHYPRSACADITGRKFYYHKLQMSNVCDARTDILDTSNWDNDSSWGWEQAFFNDFASGMSLTEYEETTARKTGVGPYTVHYDGWGSMAVQTMGNAGTWQMLECDAVGVVTASQAIVGSSLIGVLCSRTDYFDWYGNEYGSGKCHYDANCYLFIDNTSDVRSNNLNIIESGGACCKPATVIIPRSATEYFRYYLFIARKTPDPVFSIFRAANRLSYLIDKQSKVESLKAAIKTARKDGSVAEALNYATTLIFGHTWPGGFIVRKSKYSPDNSCHDDILSVNTVEWWQLHIYPKATPFSYIGSLLANGYKKTKERAINSVSDAIETLMLGGETKADARYDAASGKIDIDKYDRIKVWEVTHVEYYKAKSRAIELERNPPSSYKAYTGTKLFPNEETGSDSSIARQICSEKSEVTR